MESPAKARVGDIPGLRGRERASGELQGERILAGLVWLVVVQMEHASMSWNFEGTALTVVSVVSGSHKIKSRNGTSQTHTK